MSIKKINLRTPVLLLMMLFAVLSRLINIGGEGEWMNFTPVGAVALFGGTYFANKYKAVLLPLIILFIGDLFLNYAYFQKFVLFYDGAFWVYLSFAIMAFIGSLIKRVSVISVISASLASVLVHWLISDIGPWLYGNLYPKTFSGYIECLIMAIPFEKNMLLGNLFFGAVLYGGFELLMFKFPVLKRNPQTAS